MAIVSNSVIMSNLLRTFIKVIGRRTSENFAIEIIGTVIDKLQSTYDFIKYIRIESALYSGEMDAIHINPNINTIETHLVGEAIGKIIDNIASSLGGNEQYDFENAEYYFINEVKDELGEEADKIFRTSFGVDFSSKQSDFLSAMQEAAKIKIRRIRTSEVLNYTIKGLLVLLNKKVAEPDAIKLMAATLKKLEDDYPFLNNVHLRETPDSNGLYPLNIQSDMDISMPPKRNEAIQRLIEEIAFSTNIKTRKIFIESFRRELDAKKCLQLKKIGVKLDEIEKNLQQQIYTVIVKKTFEILIELIGKKTSPSFAVASLDNLVEQLREKHDVLTYISIDKNRYSEGIAAFQFASEINFVEEFKLGKALKEILKKTQDHLEGEAVTFVDDFKKKLGEENVLELEKIGVNLHILELRGFL